MLSEQLETIHVDLNEGFKKQMDRLEHDAHIITQNDDNLGKRVNALKEIANTLVEKYESIEKSVSTCLKNDEIMNNNFKKIHQNILLASPSMLPQSTLLHFLLPKEDTPFIIDTKYSFEKDGPSAYVVEFVGCGQEGSCSSTESSKYES